MKKVLLIFMALMFMFSVKSYSADVSNFGDFKTAYEAGGTQDINLTGDIVFAVPGLGTAFSPLDMTISGNGKTFYGVDTFQGLRLNTGDRLAVKDGVTFVGFSGSAVNASVSTATFSAISEEIIFAENNAAADGGAIYADRSDMGFSSINGRVIFHLNNADGRGGALYSDGSALKFATIYGQLFFNRNTSMLNGGSVYARDSVMEFSAIYGQIIFNENNSDSHGGSIYMEDNSSADFNAIYGAIIFSSSSAGDSGGAIYASAGSIINFNGDTGFEYNKAVSSGGALYVNQSEINFETGVHFGTNSARLGGAIFLAPDTNFVFNSTATFIGNIASSTGGAIYVSAGSTLEFTHKYGGYVDFSFNKATSTHGGGGAIYNRGNLTLSDIIFTSNMAGYRGGAIYNDAANMDISSVSFILNSVNTALSNSGGGAILNISNMGTAATMTLSNVEFSSNSVTGGTGGGALYNYSFFSYAGMVLDNVIFTSNSVSGAGAGGGGAISNYYGGLASSAVVTLNNVSFISNTVRNMNGTGGAIYNRSIGAVPSANAFLNITGTTLFIGNAASFGYGGAIHNNGRVTISGTVEFMGNMAHYAGGAIYNDAQGASGASTITFNTNSVIFTSNSVNFAGGGAIYNYGRIDTANSFGTMLFTFNRAPDGGAIYAVSGTDNYLVNVAFRDNTATTGSGGAIWSAAANFELTGTTEFARNQAVSGGAIYNNMSMGSFRLIGATQFNTNRATNGGAIYTNGNVHMNNNIQFNGNIATSSGGAIYLANNFNAGLSGSGPVSFSGNTAGLAGGAIYAAGGYPALSNASFSINTAPNGGAIYTVSNFNLTSPNFSANRATTGSGGAIYNLSTLTFFASGGQFSNNIAVSSGGAILNTGSGYISFNSGSAVTFFANSSTGTYGVGGAIYNDVSRNVSMSGSVLTFMSNTAVSSGGAVYNAGTFNATTSNLSFSMNLSSSVGGAIYNIASVSISTSQFNQNTAVKGGALYTTGSSALATFGGVSFTGNEASAGGGGAVYADVSRVNFNSDASFTGNKALTDYGGAIYANRSTMNFSGSSSIVTFSSNTALTAAAIYMTGSSVTFNVGELAFNYNNSISSNGVLYWDDETYLSFGNANITAIGNQSESGGFLYLQGKEVNFNGTVLMASNTARSGFGGAVYLENSTMSITGASATFSSNTAEAAGAIYIKGSSVTFDVAELAFNYNNSISSNGVVYWDSNSYLGFGDANVTAIGNQSESGGFLYLQGKEVSFNGTVLMSSNTARSGSGGALYGDAATIVNFGGDVVFYGNQAQENGGAIYLQQNAVTFGSDAMFAGNSVVAGNGGAIYMLTNEYEFNGEAVFTGNKALSGLGGAIYAESSTITFNDISEFSGNEADLGGALYIGAGAIVNAGDVKLTGNSAASFGGAVYMEGADENLAVMNIIATDETVIENNTAGGSNNTFYLDKYARLNLEIVADSTMTVGFGIISNDEDTQITKTGLGAMIFDGEDSEINGRFNIYEGLVRTHYAFGTGDIYFDNGTLNITDDVTMVNNIYALDINSIIDLDINEDTVTTINGFIGEGGIGNFEKNGLGKIVISGAGSNIGNTSVNFGEMLMLANDFASDTLTVQDSAILSGTGGIIGEVTNYGLVKPGYVSPYDVSFGTLTITGKYIERGDIFIRLNEGTAGSEIVPANDRLRINGSAEIYEESFIDLDMTRGFEIYRRYNVLETTLGVDGIYSGLKTIYPSFDILIGSDTNNVYLYIKDIETDYVNIPGLDHNNTEVAKIIDKITNSGDPDKINDLSKIIGTMDPLDEAGKMRVMEEVAGSIYANALMISAHQMRQAYHRILDRRDSGYEGYNMWAGIYGSQKKMEQDSNSGDFKARNGYLILGLEKYGEDSNSIMGYYLSAGQHDTHQRDDVVDINDYRFGLYGGRFSGDWTFRGEVSAGYQRYQGKRVQALLQSRTESEYDGVNVNANAEVFYRILEADVFNLSPFAGFDGSFIRTSGFKEKGYDNAAAVLTVKAKQFEMLNAVAGVRAENEVGILRWYGELGARYNLRGSKGQFNATLNNLDDEMNIYGAGNSLLSGKAEIGFSADIWRGVEVFAMGSYEKAERFYQVVGETGIGYRFGGPKKKEPVKEQITDSNAKIPADEIEAEEDAIPAAIAALKKQIELTKVLFDFDKYNLNSEAKQAVEEIAAALKEIRKLDSSITIILEGHTDEEGSNKYNDVLSKKRANTVHKKLMELGIEADMLEKEWYGKTRLIETSGTDRARAQNRRCEVVLK
ncbi:MAG: OmpA family protein [Endomicrobia bacterium]|nr:OmpA family protein [Endomicrobiia bacterium]